LGTREQRNQQVVRRAIAALNQKDLDLFFSYHTEDTTSHEVYFPEPLPRGTFRSFLDSFLRAYPDTHIETRNMIAEGDTVVVENVMSATFTHDLGETKATGRSFTTREAVVFELADGKIKATRIYQDQKTIEEQQGVR